MNKVVLEGLIFIILIGKFFDIQLKRLCEENKKKCKLSEKKKVFINQKIFLDFFKDGWFFVVCRLKEQKKRKYKMGRMVDFDWSIREDRENSDIRKK